MVEQPIDVESRAAALAQGADLGWVCTLLESQRDAILAAWLDAATLQPFHAAHREHAVTDHIPQLYDALLAYLQQSAPRHRDPGSPLNDAAVVAAAQQHARSRLNQGLEPVDVVTEFRLLRQQLLGTLRQHLPDSVPTGDIIAAELLLNDALDGVVSVALRALTELIEEVREDFLATTVHDVRQPLSLIKGAAQLALRHLQAPTPNVERGVADVTIIEAAAGRMETVLATLLDASRIALGQLKLDAAPTDLAALAESVVGQLDAETAQRVTVQVAPGVATSGVWDRGRLERVLANLLSNAVKYSPPGTPIQVNVGGAPDRTDMVEVTVQDQGIGIEGADLPRLFRRYVRGKAAVAQGIQGVGLGLYLCRGIVEAHGGRIWATSAGPGHGTTIHLTLPYQPPDAGNQADERSNPDRPEATRSGPPVAHG
jgi:signal transduction histidine kinase